VGWNFTAQMPAYHVANVGDVGIGGIMDFTDDMKGMSPFWSGYIFTPDVDAAAAQAVKLGGKIYKEPWDVPGVLRMAVLADPTGAAFNIMQPLMPDPGKRAGEGAAGTVGWNELHTTDPKAAWDFYAGMFGWTKGATHNMGPEVGDYQLFQIDGKDAGGMMKKMAMTPMSLWQYYFNVNGMDAAHARVSKAGGSAVMGPHQVPGGDWIMVAKDPQGGHFALLSKTK
jgi:uncharacterized protein